MNREYTRIFRAVKLFCIIPYGNTYNLHLSKPIKCTILKGNPNVICGLWVIILHQCRVINSNKYTTMVEIIDSGRGYTCI